PGYYLTLKELVLDDAHLERDFDLVHIQQLPNLERLHLEGTDIGNETVAIKFLTQSILTGHPEREVVLSEPCAAVIHAEDRVIDIEIPFGCEKYIDNLHKQYLVDPALPLITDPSACPLLSDVALIRNLKGHVDVNPSIVLTGTRLEMIERLKKPLERIYHPLLSNLYHHEKR
ncbi:hypothetical protein BDR06DRAFT_870570, partial [Suillus hirtellus]